MGSSLSPIVCNLYIESFEQTVLATALHWPTSWCRYVDDTHTIHQKIHSPEFTDNWNTQDDDITWTMEGKVKMEMPACGGKCHGWGGRCISQGGECTGIFGYLDSVGVLVVPSVQMSSEKTPHGPMLELQQQPPTGTHEGGCMNTNEQSGQISES